MSRPLEFCSKHFPCEKCKRHYYKDGCSIILATTVGSQDPLDEDSARAIAEDEDWYRTHGSESKLRTLYDVFPAIKPPPVEQGHYILSGSRWYLSQEQSDWIMDKAGIKDFYYISLDTSNSIMVAMMNREKDADIGANNREMFPCWTYSNLYNWYHLPKEAEEPPKVQYSRDDLVAAILCYGVTPAQAKHGSLPELAKAAAAHAFVKGVDVHTPTAEILRVALTDLSENGRFFFKD